VVQELRGADSPMAQWRRAMTPDEFTEEQRLYLEGFAAACNALGPQASAPTFAATLGASVANGPDDARSIHWHAQDQQTSAGAKLSAEEQAKRAKDPFQMWDEMVANAQAGAFPKGKDVFLYKYHGLFHVAPAQNAFMCRLRIHGGITNSHQMRGLADIAERFAGGYA